MTLKLHWATYVRWGYPYTKFHPGHVEKFVEMIWNDSIVFPLQISMNVHWVAIVDAAGVFVVPMLHVRIRKALLCAPAMKDIEEMAIVVSYHAPL